MLICLRNVLKLTCSDIRRDYKINAIFNGQSPQYVVRLSSFGRRGRLPYRPSRGERCGSSSDIRRALFRAAHVGSAMTWRQNASRVWQA